MYILIDVIYILITIVTCYTLLHDIQDYKFIYKCRIFYYYFTMEKGKILKKKKNIF